MSTVLQTNGLSKTFAGKKAVSRVNMCVQKGDIYGFIGKNGAGKTTLIRMVVGLASPSEGNIKLFESEDLNKQRQKIGTVIEYPAVFPHMTARENLITQCKLQGVSDLKVVAKTLDMVGLNGTGRKKAKNFSLGMKQRLAIAIALIGNPEFLCLDEPTNGLDPEGIREIRELIQKLNHEYGITVLISSHILGELSKLATRYGIIHDGVLVKEFTAQELEQLSQTGVALRVNDNEKALTILKRDFGIAEYSIKDDGMIHIFNHVDKSAAINAALMHNDIVVEEIYRNHVDLEQYFIETVGGK